MFFITCFSRCKKNDLTEMPIALYDMRTVGDETEMPNFCDKRTFGYFEDYETCTLALHENWCDMREACYQYAVVEYIEQGIHSMAKEIEWFQWDEEKEGFFEIPKPQCTNRTFNHALG